MKLNGNFALRKICDVYYAVPLGESSKKIKGMIKLNDTGAFIWEKIEKGLSDTEIITALSEKFGISQEVASEDFAEFTNALKEVEILV